MNNLTREKVFEQTTRVFLGYFEAKNGAKVPLQAELAERRNGGGWKFQAFMGDMNVWHMGPTGNFTYKGSHRFKDLDEVITAYNEFMIPYKFTFDDDGL